MDNKNNFLLHYIQTDSCWIVQETGEKIEFGEIAVDYLNYWERIYDKYNNKMHSLLDNGCSFKSNEMKRFERENKFVTDNYSIIENFIDTIEMYLMFDNGKVKETKWKPNKDSITPVEKQREIQTYLIKQLNDNGWKDIDSDERISIIDLLLINEREYIDQSLKVSFRLVNHKWYPTYETTQENAFCIAMLDLQQIRNIDNIDFAFCKNCNTTYIRRNPKSRYCADCSQIYKSINDKNRKSTPRGLHKKVSTYLRNSEKFTADEQAQFLNESNYYWDVLMGKIPKDTNKYSDIATIQEYVKWLETKHKEFKEIAKNRKKCY